jgi:glycosyltransferase involved in cell wall biosynthesis
MWTHLGSGPLEASLKAQARELPSHVHWRFAGQVANRAVLDFYRSQPVDLFLNVSSTEGLPVSVMEALSFGIPVAATEVGGTPELVNDDNGRLLPANITAAELAAVLTEFHTLPAGEKQAVRDAAWQTWSEKANAEQQYGDFAVWLRNLVD